MIVYKIVYNVHYNDIDTLFMPLNYLLLSDMSERWTQQFYTSVFFIHITNKTIMVYIVIEVTQMYFFTSYSRYIIMLYSAVNYYGFLQQIS